MLCSVGYVEHMTLAEQVKLYSQAQVLVMTHGASIGNIIFMSPVSLQLAACYICQEASMLCLVADAAVALCYI